MLQHCYAHRDKRLLWGMGVQPAVAESSAITANCAFVAFPFILMPSHKGTFLISKYQGGDVCLFKSRGKKDSASNCDSEDLVDMALF